VKKEETLHAQNNHEDIPAVHRILGDGEGTVGRDGYTAAQSRRF